MPLTARVKVVTGRTRHFVHGLEMAAPAAVIIIEDDPGFLLLRLNSAGEEMTDTWHESLAAAKGQAKFEYEIEDGDWKLTDD
jgi:hypothetical protein